MKRIISLILMVLILCTLCVPAFAEDASAVASKSIAQLAVSDGSFVTSPTGVNQFDYGTEESGITKYSFYFALVDGDNLYLSNAINDKNITAPPAATSLSFASQNNGSTTFSKLAAAEGFQGAGKWSAAAVPEPTSGLLLLLGVAGLALKRRRA